MNITKEQLIEFGMIETTGDEKVLFPLKKVISEASDNGEDDGELSICVYMGRLALLLPDGALIYILAESIDELKAFEKSIAGYEPNY